jgi:hypothetical protein
MTEPSAKVCPNTVSPKKAGRASLVKKLNPLQKKMKEIAHKKMSRDVELAALRNSLPRLNAIKHCKLNKELHEAVFEQVKPEPGNFGNVSRPNTQMIGNAMQNYQRIVDQSSSDSDSVHSSAMKSYHSFYTEDQDIDEEELRAARKTCKTDEERRDLFKL